jgi:general secretion pathway protein D
MTSLSKLLFGLTLPWLAACSLLPERTARLIDGGRPPTMADPAPAPAAPGPLATGDPLALDDRAGQAEPLIRRGSGRVVGTPGTRSVPAASPAGAAGTVLNFQGVDVREVVQEVLGERLGLNYVIDPAVTGPVTLRSSSPLSDEALLAAMEDVLAAAGAALVRDGDLHRVVPREQAPRSASARVGRSLRGTAPGYAIQVVPLSFVGVAEMEGLLRPVAREGAILRADPARNLLVLGGSRDELATLLDLVDAFDVDWLSGRSVGLFPLVSAPAEAIVAELEEVFGTGADGPPGTIRFLPVERMNGVLVISQRPALLDEVRTWIRQLDRDVGGDGMRLYTYSVQNGRASDLAGVLGRVFGASPAPGPAEPEGAPVAPGTTVTERVYRQGPADAAAVPDVARGPGASRPPGGRLAGGDPARREAPPQDAQRTITLPGEGAASPIRVTADDSNNALVIRATPSDFRTIEAALRRLDVRPLQVLIEATIAEVTLNDQLRFGLQYFFSTGNLDIVLSSDERGTVDPVFPGLSVLRRPADARVALSALEAITDLNVISSPQLMVLNNQTAVLQVGDQVPVPVQSAVSVLNPDAPVVNTIQYRDTGVILYVTPRVNANGLVTLEVAQEVSDVVRTTSSDIDAPTIQQRRIESTVAVGTGETIALGGLIRDAQTKSRTGIPVLSSIPVLGALFSTTDNTAGRTELLVMITPRVVRDGREARDVTEELRRRLRNLGPL